MDLLNEIVAFFLRPFVAWAITASIVGQVMKTQVFTRDRAKDTGSKLHLFWKWARKTLPLHPVAVGAAIGLVWPGTIEDGYQGGTIAGVLYFAIAGALSVWTFETLKGVLKKYEGIELGPLPGQSEPPPPRL